MIDCCCCSIERLNLPDLFSRKYKVLAIFNLLLSLTIVMIIYKHVFMLFSFSSL